MVIISFVIDEISQCYVDESDACDVQVDSASSKSSANGKHVFVFACTFLKIVVLGLLAFRKPKHMYYVNFSLYTGVDSKNFALTTTKTDFLLFISSFCL